MTELEPELLTMPEEEFELWRNFFSLPPEKRKEVSKAALDLL